MNLYKRLRYYLIEMSDNKSKIEEDIRHAVPQIVNHLIKCLLINDPDNIKHWENEIYGFLNEVHLLKGSNKLPSEKMLYRCTIGLITPELSIRINKYVSQVCRKENIKTPNYNKDALCTCILSYLTWLIKNLSTEGIVEDIEVQNKVNQLIQQYNSSITKQKVGA